MATGLSTIALPCWWTSKKDSPSRPRARLVSAGRVTLPFELMETMLRTRRKVYRTHSNSHSDKLPLDRNANHPLSSAFAMSRSVLAKRDVKGTAVTAVAPYAQSDARPGGCLL